MGCVGFSGCGAGLCLTDAASSTREERSGSASLDTNYTLHWPVSLGSYTWLFVCLEPVKGTGCTNIPVSKTDSTSWAADIFLLLHFVGFAAFSSCYIKCGLCCNHQWHEPEEWTRPVTLFRLEQLLSWIHWTHCLSCSRRVCRAVAVWRGTAEGGEHLHGRTESVWRAVAVHTEPGWWDQELPARCHVRSTHPSQNSVRIWHSWS